RERHGIGILPALLVRECSALQEGGLAESQTTAKGDCWRLAVRPRERFAWSRRLTEFEFIVAPVLEARFIEELRGERRSQPQIERVNVDEVIAKALATVRHGRIGLDPGWRVPAHAVVDRGEGMLTG